MRRSPVRDAVGRDNVRRIKVTFYLELRDLAALEKERDRRRHETGRRRGVDLSALVREAIRRAYTRNRGGA